MSSPDATQPKHFFVHNNIPKLMNVETPKLMNVEEDLKGKVESPATNDPTTAKLGEPHPFDFKKAEKLYLKETFVHGAIDKLVDFTVGPGFFVRSPDKGAQQIAEDFMRDVQFEEVMRAWVREGLVKGNGFMEIGYTGSNPTELAVLDATRMFIKRDDHGNVKGYMQAPIKQGDKPVPFKPNEMVHLPITKIGGGAYGFGEVFPPMVAIDAKIGLNKDMHTVIHRKANSPYHVQIGDDDHPASQKDVNRVGGEIQALGNKHEWATDHLTNIKVLEFGNVNDKFEFALEHDRQALIDSFQVPDVLMGKGRIPEGLAKVQLEAFEMRIKSIQSAIEKVLEEQL